MELTVFDKFSWHFDAGVNEAILLKYFSKLMNFLKKHQLLSIYGLEIYDLGVDSSLSITSKMLTEKGIGFLSLWYDKYLKSIDFNRDIDLSFLEGKILNSD